MKVSEAVDRRKSVRAFLPTPVDRTTIERVLDRARRAPSGGNVQPWHAIVLAGEPLRQFFTTVRSAAANGDTVAEFPSYPASLPHPWLARRRGCGFDMYATLGIAREDRAARDAQTARNYVAFDAPCFLLCHMPRLMGVAQWADLGIWLQTVMLLLEEEGLASCPQAAWAHIGSAVRAAIDIPEDHVLYCGLAIGHADPDAPINTLRTARAPLEETVRFIGL